MTIVRATCPICGDLELTNDDVTLHVWTGKSRQCLNHYTFTCPKHRELLSKHADGEVIALLVRGGVKVIRTNVPDEVDDVHRLAAPLTVDWVLDAINELQARRF